VPETVGLQRETTITDWCQQGTLVPAVLKMDGLGAGSGVSVVRNEKEKAQSAWRRLPLREKSRLRWKRAGWKWLVDPNRLPSGTIQGVL